MKSMFSLFVLSACLLCIYQCEKEPDPNEIVDIPDAEFLRYLILDGVDTNGDSHISYAEALTVTKIYLDPDSTGRRNGKVSSVAGIEAFKNLDTLHCCFNQIKELDVSENTALRVLVLWNNDENDQLEYVNVSGNTKLETISILGNKLSALDVSNCSSLNRLWCGFNQLTSLDVSKNTHLSCLDCSGNQLSSLDLSENRNFGTRCIPAVSLRDMPSLTEVCVWTLFPINGFEIDTTGSPNVFFTTDCSK